MDLFTWGCRCGTKRLSIPNLTQWPHNPLRRGGQTGYSIYVDKTWARDQQEARLTKELADIPEKRLKALRSYEATLAELKQQEDNLTCSLAEIRVKQMGGPW
jgi:hypothetical protein